MSKEDFVDAISSEKEQSCAAAELLIQELILRFPNSEIMEALGMVFSQYWMQGKCNDLSLDIWLSLSNVNVVPSLSRWKNVRMVSPDRFISH